MYETTASSTQKCFAYAVSDHLNCVTLDCWPSQVRLMSFLGFQSTKTLQRAARGLERISVLRINGGGRAGYRYAPVFLPSDSDKIVPQSGHSRPRNPDKTVSESFLAIHSKSGSRQEAANELQDGNTIPAFERYHRGAIEIKIAELLGSDGIDVLMRLGGLNDAIVERLCVAYSIGALGERELFAARLAAEQAR